MEKQKLIGLFDKQAVRYAKQREDKNQIRWRQNLLSEARGDVLEIAVGAGANFPFYPSDVNITATDFSPEMLKRAQQAASEYHRKVNFICSDLEELDFPGHSFDTIVSTLSLCSYENPLRVLQNLRRWCRPDGKILLLEHGISTISIVSTIQRGLNPVLYRVYGCHHTRDITGLVQASGISIDKEELHWLNMVHVIWGNPSQ